MRINRWKVDATVSLSYKWGMQSAMHLIAVRWFTIYSLDISSPEDMTATILDVRRRQK